MLPDPRHADEPVHVSARAEGRDRAARRPLHGRRRGLPLGGQGPPARPDRGDDGEAVPARRAPARDPALGPVLHGRDGHRPHPPRLLALHRFRAPALRARQSLRARDARLLQAAGLEARAAAAVRRRRDGGARRLGSRREADGRRHLHQRVAAPRGLSRAARGTERADAPDARPHRLVSHRCVGRGRLLLPSVPQRGGSRAGRGRLPGRLRARADRAEGAARGARRRPGTADRHGRAPAGGAVRRSARNRARPSRLLRRPLLAKCRSGRHRDGARVRERHRARRREPRARGAVRARRGRRAGRRRAAARAPRRRADTARAPRRARAGRDGRAEHAPPCRRGRAGAASLSRRIPSRTRPPFPVRLESGWWRGVAPGATPATE